jgi:D-inositol-3-phosphate glycosyltransferase
MLGKNHARVDNQTMRVALISYHTCPLATLGGKETGGMNVYVRDLVRQLGRHGIGADVFTRSQDEHVPHVLHQLGYGNRIVHVPAGPEVPLEKEGLTDHLPAFTEWILEFARSKGIQYDLIHSHYWLSGLSALELKKEWGVPIIQMFHTLAVMKNRVARSEHEIAPQVRLDAERKLIREADCIVASTQAELAQIQWLYQEDISRTVVIPPGVDTTRFYPIPADEAKEYVGVPAEHRIILFVGRMVPLKGIDSLLRAMALMAREGAIDCEQVCLQLIGGDSGESEEQLNLEMRRLERLCDRLGIADIVTFLGKRDQDTLQYYYSAAEIVVLPSHYESFGLAALEAMACGTPVVASETGGLVFLIQDGETGFHVPTADPESLADRLKLLLNDDQLRERMGQAAAEYAKQYAWPIIADQVVELYQQVDEKRTMQAVS